MGKNKWESAVSAFFDLTPSLPLPRQLWPEKRKKDKKRRRRKRAESISKGPPFPQQKKGQVLLRPLRQPVFPYTYKRKTWKKSVPFSHIENISLTQERPPIAARGAAQLQGGGEEDPGQHTGEAGGIWHDLKNALVETYFFEKKNHLLDGKEKYLS